ncbi:MAG: methyltransferase domain-containing protein [Burkholderiales bacterium]|nr:methyltransferase domain-containing protein [Burkholderiales bacterium]
MEDHQDLIRREFSQQAEAMSKAALFNDAGILNRIREAAQLTRQSRVLDVACGPGIVVEALAPAAGEVVGCDITPEMLAKARQRCAASGLTNVRFEPGRAEALPFEDASFDVVVSRSALHHFPDVAAALREMARVVRAGGRVVILDVISSENEAEAALHNALETLRDPSHVRMLPKSELQSVLENANLTVETCTEWSDPREFEDWLKITNAPERAHPLRVVMMELAGKGATAGIGMRLDGGKILFEHAKALTVAVKRASVR